MDAKCLGVFLHWFLLQFDSCSAGRCRPHNRDLVVHRPPTCIIHSTAALNMAPPPPTHTHKHACTKTGEVGHFYSLGFGAQQLASLKPGSDLDVERVFQWSHVLGVNSRSYSHVHLTQVAVAVLDDVSMFGAVKSWDRTSAAFGANVQVSRVDGHGHQVDAQVAREHDTCTLISGQEHTHTDVGSTCNHSHLSVELSAVKSSSHCPPACSLPPL